MAESKKRSSRLGRGLSSLMAQPVPTQPATGGKPAAKAAEAHAQSEQDADAPEGLRHLSVAAISPNRHQPRQQFDEAALKSLADSIRADGLMQPIVVRPDASEKGRYELVAGERRWRAAQIAALETLPAIVRELDDRQIAEWALIENLQREDLNPIERAAAFRRLGEQFDMGHEAIAARVGLDRSTVTNLLRLLALAPGVQDLLRNDLLSMGQARALAGVTDAASQEALARRAVKEGMSVREVERAVRSLTQEKTGGAEKGSQETRSSHFRDLEQQIGHQLGTRVAIAPGRKKGSGKLTIEFFSIDQFDNLLDKLGVQAEE